MDTQQVAIQQSVIIGNAWSTLIANEELYKPKCQPSLILAMHAFSIYDAFMDIQKLTTWFLISLYDWQRDERKIQKQTQGEKLKTVKMQGTLFYGFRSRLLRRLSHSFTHSVSSFCLFPLNMNPFDYLYPSVRKDAKNV